MYFITFSRIAIIIPIVLGVGVTNLCWQPSVILEIFWKTVIRKHALTFQSLSRLRFVNLVYYRLKWSGCQQNLVSLVCRQLRGTWWLSKHNKTAKSAQSIHSIIVSNADDGWNHVTNWQYPGDVCHLHHSSATGDLTLTARQESFDMENHHHQQ